MPKQRILYLSTLVEKKACTKQVDLFQELFGESVTVTEKRAVSVADKFAWHWATDKLLSRTALDEYNKARQTALDEYEKKRRTAWDEYCKFRAKTFANLYINDKSKR